MGRERGISTIPGIPIWKWLFLKGTLESQTTNNPNQQLKHLVDSESFNHVETSYRKRSDRLMFNETWSWCLGVWWIPSFWWPWRPRCDALRGWQEMSFLSKKIDGSVFLCFFFLGLFQGFFPAGDISTKKWAEVIRRRSGSLVAFYVSIGCDFFPVGFQTSLGVPPQMPPPPTEIRLYWGIINHHHWGGVALKFPWSLKAEGERGEGRGRIPKAVADGTWDYGGMMVAWCGGTKGRRTKKRGVTLPLFFGDVCLGGV